MPNLGSQYQFAAMCRSEMLGRDGSPMRLGQTLYIQLRFCTRRGFATSQIEKAKTRS